MSTTTHPAISADFAAGFRGMMLDGLINEMQIAKKVIQAIPEAKKEWRPEPNARTAWELAWHIASTDVWFLNGIADRNFPKEEHGDTSTQPKTIAELGAWYEREFKKGLKRVEGMNPQQLAQMLSFMGAFNLPAFAYLQFLNNHLIHHRGQLATYLRPMGSKVPSIYGGSFDEPWKG